MREVLDSRHFYAAYVFDQAEMRQHDIEATISEANRLGYPVRYWWLSDAMDLRDAPDRLIVCVHHPVLGENAGMDLYTALINQKVAWDDLDAAAMEEYGQLGRGVSGADGIFTSKGGALFPSPKQA
ncbi:MAG: hypothetical protein MN733_19995 [Nitrososphaera sp.]|nr:hypothetical protein [Nitrososphaera sp.]